LDHLNKNYLKGMKLSLLSILTNYYRGKIECSSKVKMEKHHSNSMKANIFEYSSLLVWELADAPPRVVETEGPSKGNNIYNVPGRRSSRLI